MNLKKKAEAGKFSKPYSWIAISALLKNTTGQEFDYDTFKQLVDTTPDLKQFFHSFDKRGITLTAPEIGDTVNGATSADSGNIDASAKRAAANTLKRPG